MEWAVGGVVGFGALLYFILAMAGAGKPGNLKGFRLKLFGMCMVWPVTLVVLACVIIWKVVSARKTDVAAPSVVVTHR